MPNFDLENKYRNLHGYKTIIAGVDEAGRGPLAGPVVAAAVIVNSDYIIKDVKDSKKLSRKKREELYQEITKHHIYSVAIISPQEIDEINILEATKKACVNAVSRLSLQPDIILVDGNMKFLDKRFISIIKGDDLSYSISAASIVAKISRDRIMTELSNEFPSYNWQQNCGYGTKAHMESIKLNGLSVHHRKTFKITT